MGCPYITMYGIKCIHSNKKSDVNLFVLIFGTFPSNQSYLKGNDVNTWLGQNWALLKSLALKLTYWITIQICVLLDKRNFILQLHLDVFVHSHVAVS